MATKLVLEDDELALIISLFKGGTGPFSLAPVVERLRAKLEAALSSVPPPKTRKPPDV